jgi:hypothetical protein
LIDLSAVQNIKFSGYRPTLSQRFLHGSEKPFLWKYVTGQLEFTSNVSFWCKNVLSFDEIVSLEAFSVFPLVDNDITNADFDIQMWKWFELFTPKQVNKRKFLELFANHFTEKITFDSWFHKVTDFTHENNMLNPSFDSQLELYRRVCKKSIHFLIPLATKDGGRAKFWSLKPER